MSVENTVVPTYLQFQILWFRLPAVIRDLEAVCVYQNHIYGSVLSMMSTGINWDQLGVLEYFLCINRTTVKRKQVVVKDFYCLKHNVKMWLILVNLARIIFSPESLVLCFC